MGKTISIYTNLVHGGWSPLDLEKGIGGSEEKLIEFAKKLVERGHEVRVYMNGQQGVFDKVWYLPHNLFNPFQHVDVFISFKAAHTLLNSINADKILHWTTEVEPEWAKFMLESVDQVVTISNYHNAKMKPESPKFKPIYLWADFDRLARNKVPKKKGTMLYASSFDRGLEELLIHWPTVKEKLKIHTLNVTYGWDFMINMFKANPKLKEWREKMDRLLRQDGVNLIGRLSNDDMCKEYWRAEYWALPLSNPDSELFCINAIKAQYCGAIPVVRKIGALQETVNECINFDEILGRPNQKSTYTKGSIERNKKHAARFTLEAALKEWGKLEIKL